MVRMGVRVELQFMNPNLRGGYDDGEWMGFRGYLIFFFWFLILNASFNSSAFRSFSSCSSWLNSSATKKERVCAKSEQG